jgi:hypothetical protein
MYVIWPSSPLLLLVVVALVAGDVVVVCVCAFAEILILMIANDSNNTENVVPSTRAVLQYRDTLLIWFP